MLMKKCSNICNGHSNKTTDQYELDTMENINQHHLLVALDVSWNSLTGILSKEHFSKLSKLKLLWTHGNLGLILNVSSTRVPPFQITSLYMKSCNLGHSFSTWLKSQKEVFILQLSNASISGSMPNWFWNFSSNVWHLGLSHNQL